DAMIKSQDTILVCATVASQVAALAALQVGRAYSAPYVRELAEVREMVRRELSSLAPLVTVPPADGAFYVLLKVNGDPAARGRLTDMAIAERLVRDHQVAVVPGTAFGMTDGVYFRVAYGALQKATVAEGVGRLVAGLRAIVG